VGCIFQEGRDGRREREPERHAISFKVGISFGHAIAFSISIGYAIGGIREPIGIGIGNAIGNAVAFQLRVGLAFTGRGRVDFGIGIGHTIRFCERELIWHYALLTALFLMTPRR
jgi:hypothetical protein